jgi:hypothetical protein
MLRMMLLSLALLGCATTSPASNTTMKPTSRAPSFQDDVGFLGAHTQVVVLKSADGRAQVAVAPGYQGRVMTSTASGAQGASYGYIHRPGVAGGVRMQHMTVLGGEDRFWLGPEGGPYALYFAPGVPADVEHWQVPEAIDWGAWPVLAQSEREITFQKDMALVNRAGTALSLRATRSVRLLDDAAVTSMLSGASCTGCSIVAYESDNQIENTGADAWQEQSGLVSIWILGMFQHAPRTTVVIPYVAGEERGAVVNDKYFGAIAPERLKIDDKAIFFRADGTSRGKIGVARAHARDVAGSYDPDGRVLTLVQFTLPEGAHKYVNSMWDQTGQDAYAGDVVNSYNDGPLTPGGAAMGPFYEIESSSPAAALAPKETLRHVHRTLHVQGPEAELDALARRVLGVSLTEITSALAR